MSRICSEFNKCYLFEDSTVLGVLLFLESLLFIVTITVSIVVIVVFVIYLQSSSHKLARYIKTNMHYVHVSLI